MNELEGCFSSISSAENGLENEIIIFLKPKGKKVTTYNSLQFRGQGQSLGAIDHISMQVHTLKI
jgi:hypothetical protein